MRARRRDSFIGPWALIGAFHRRDIHHQEAIQIVLAADEGRIPPLVLTDYILAETLNFINRKGSHDMAVGALRRLESSQGIRIDRITSGLYESTKNDVVPEWKGLSFVDASIVAYMKAHKVKSLYSFDSGFDLVPGIQRLERLA